jgi:tRNA (guanine37-N1)-methyltransferase
VRIDVVTIFPEYLRPLGLSLVGRAQASGLLDVRVHDLRTWASDPHRSVDDTPYGGGPGMIMRPEPWGKALDELLEDRPEGHPPPRLIVPTPGGRLFTQRLAEELSAERWLVFACGRYEGIDARVVEEAATRMPVDEVSIGDYVLGGGEVAALVMVEAVVRLLPGVLGNPDSLAEESHREGLLEYPGYTKPPTWRGRAVPDVLLSGHHAAIARWRRDEALRRTARRRPDLVARLDPARLDAADRSVLAEQGWQERDGRFTLGPPPVAD